MSDKKIRKLVLAALLAALVCVATMVVQIPSPMQGYVNLGDCFVLLSGWLLGPWYGFAAGGIGSMATATMRPARSPSRDLWRSSPRWYIKRWAARRCPASSAAL